MPERLFLAAIIALMFGCDGRSSSTTPPTRLATRPPTTKAAPATTSSTTRPIRFLALGDSYTIGESVEASERWPVRLAELLRKDNVSVDPPVIVAVTAYVTGDLIARLDRQPVAGQFDLVSLMIGVNDQYQGRAEDEFARDFAELLKRSIAFAGGDPARVIVLSIPDYGVTPFGKRAGRGREAEEISRPIDRLNALESKRVSDAGASWIDVTSSRGRPPAI